ncbi:calaxin isoform X1 [Thunnus thynnus]|uniref:calaxin isoform X1 n=1 Tax=Thunnus thynnus TaxID=8237 RepID=UPI00352989FB
MSQMQLLRLFISERLSAAAEEIFAAVQRTLTEAEEETARFKQDSNHHGLKEEVHLHSKDPPQVFVCAGVQELYQQAWSPESCHNNPTVGQEDCDLLVQEPPAIKQEQQGSWSSPVTEGTGANTFKFPPVCVYSELQSHDTGIEDRKPELSSSAEHREEGNPQPSTECCTFLPDCSVTLSNMGSELSLETLTDYSTSKDVKVHTKSRTRKKQLTKSCEPHTPTPPNQDTKRSGKSYCCRFCGKEFSRSVHLATHTRIHTGEKLFNCEVCGKEFRHGNSVIVHMRIHTEDKPYSCRICGKEFRHVGNLNVHMRIHTGEKPYSCKVCGKQFSRNNLMTKHMAVHTGEMSLGMRSVSRRGSVGMPS